MSTVIRCCARWRTRSAGRSCSHLTEELGVGQPLVSHHLKVLREAGLVEGERFRYWTYYRLVPGAFGEIANLLRGLPTAAGQRDRRACD
jgi:ArsR family transcriptional regulator, arsenate/arsenite/antimonite-responsive transcriptional repressor